MSSSTFLPTIIMRSASSSMTTTMYGSGVRFGIFDWSSVGSLAAICNMTGSSMGLPESLASFTCLLKPEMLRTPRAAMSW